jgi:Protein of unknown function (DUF3089)
MTGVGVRRRSLLAGLIATAAVSAALVAPAGASAKPVWLCKPGIADNPCQPGMQTTELTPDGQPSGVVTPKTAKKPKYDCFYVYPTVSDDKSTNSDLSIDPEERSIALYQAARYSKQCRVFAPMYRQVTLQTLTQTGGESGEPAEIAYSDVLAAWKYYLKKYNKGRGVVLIGHSQGTFMLRRLITEQVDKRKKQRKKLISAILLGGNVLVKAGSDKGGDFQRVKACTSPKQIGCAVAFSTFNAPPPANAIFGRTGEAGDQVLCTNPAKLGGTGELDSVYPSAPFAPGTTIGLATGLVGLPQPQVSTPWIESHAFTGQCSSADSANVLEITGLPGAPQLHAVPDATWGLHLTDANVALGNLTSLVAKQAKHYLKKN